MKKQRALNLDDAAVEQIVRILDGWTEKLTWDLLIAAIKKRLNREYTRQALDKHERIKTAFQLTKERLGAAPKVKSPDKLSPAEVQVLSDRVQRLQAENERLKVENVRLLEQFVVWAYNAHLRGLSKEVLSAPLPAVDRDRTHKP